MKVNRYYMQIKILGRVGKGEKINVKDLTLQLMVG